VHLDEHRCLDLLLGLLPPAEEESVMSHVTGCPACEKLLRERAAAAERLEATRVLATSPAGELVLQRRGSAVHAEEPDAATRAAAAAEAAGRIPEGRGKLLGIWTDVREGLQAGFRQPRYRLAAGLAVAAAVCMLVLWPGPEGPSVPDGFHPLPSYTFELQSRVTPGTGPPADLVAGLVAYERADYGNAVELLTRAGTPAPDEVDETVRKIYLGSALTWRGRFEEAVEVLADVRFALVPGQWGREAHWTYYLACRESGRTARADSRLQILARKPGEIGERARRAQAASAVD